MPRALLAHVLIIVQHNYGLATCPMLQPTLISLRPALAWQQSAQQQAGPWLRMQEGWTLRMPMSFQRDTMASM